VTSGDPAALTADPAAAAAALADLSRTARGDGAEAVVVGGGPLALAARILAARAPLPVVEPIPAAVRLALRRTSAAF
jgi:allantoin racemase